ncbi:MAG: hypothetical protein ACH0QD_13120 [Tepidibacillus sp.]
MALKPYTNFTRLKTKEKILDTYSVAATRLSLLRLYFSRFHLPVSALPSQVAYLTHGSFTVPSFMKTPPIAAFSFHGNLLEV